MTTINQNSRFYLVMRFLTGFSCTYIGRLRIFFLSLLQNGLKPQMM